MLRRLRRKKLLVGILIFILLLGFFKIVSAKREAKLNFWKNLIEKRQETENSSQLKWWQRFGKSKKDSIANTAPSEVPNEYKELYSLLDSKLTTSIKNIDSKWDGKKSNVVLSAGLITANPNAGDLLLQPSTLETTKKYLDRLQGLGVKGVAVDINYPLLDRKFYEGGNESKYDSYLNFYKTLFSEIEKRGMVAEVEVQPIFPDYSTLDVKPYFKQLTFDEYKSRVLEMLKVVAVELEPAYLTVANEPDTAAHNSGQPLANLDNYIGAVEFWTNGLRDAGLAKNAKLGAGFGTWYKDYKKATPRLASLKNIDFINIHIYPVDGDLFERALEIADIAAQSGKSVAIHESWLYKWKLGERSSGGIAAAGEIYGRDIFDYWQPLDKKFIEAEVKMAHYKNMEYVSFFWSNYFFKYFTYEEGSKIPEKQRMTKGMIEGAKAAVSGDITETGKYYQELIK